MFKKQSLLLVLLASVNLGSVSAEEATKASPASPVAEDCPALTNFELKRLGSAQSLRICDAFKDQVILVVNTASKCEFTYQYEGLEALYQKYRDQGLVVLGFPSNDFNQEPEGEERIAEFCKVNYGVKFPMFEKVNVRGDDAHPFFKALAEADVAPRWNFYKYLIGRDGQLIDSWSSFTNPDNAGLDGTIRTALEAKR